jgi:hypothetical protein
MNRKAEGDKRQLNIAVAIMLFSLCMVFVWGSYFGIFGTPIRANFKYLGFAFWIVLGIFGLGYATGGFRTGLSYAGKFTLLLLGAVTVGVLTGRYR